MKICTSNSAEYIIIEDFFEQHELSGIWREIAFLTPKLLGPEHTYAATEEGAYLKKNTGLFLDDTYAKRETSDILVATRKLWSPEILAEIAKMSPWWRLLGMSTRDTTLLNCYKDNEYYNPHSDQAVITAITTLYKEPVNFTGGDFVISEYGVSIPKCSNTMVIFPSAAKHRVTPVKMLETEVANPYRYSIAQFVFVGH